ncbi:Ig-like domain-containing protein, partial [Pseudomonas sp. 13B_3.2_Bac1]|nr:Ig-like domain-containing protein [Pseudomonas sp. 13B_3.2_Bac1]
EETSLSNPLVFTVGVALELLAPWIKENNGDSALNPLLVRDTLTAVVPDNPELRPTDEIIVTWTGAQGTPAGGSHTSVPRPLGSNREFAIPNSVVAFNLNKDVKVSYVVIRDGKPLPSLVFDLTVLSMPQNELLKPIIKDADNNGEGPEFNVGKLTANAIYRMGIWPLIAPLQYVWLRLTGTNADGSDYNLQIHTAPGSYVTDGWITQGYLERNIALAGLRNLKDGSTLTMAFKAAFGKDPNESLAVAFPVRTYTVRALVEVRPDITRVEGSKGEISEGGETEDTTITLTGTASLGQQVQIKDGTTIIEDATADASSGIWTLVISGLAEGCHIFTATALYGSGQESIPRSLEVVSERPVIKRMTDAAGGPIDDLGTTNYTSVNLGGTAAAGQQVQILDGTTVKKTEDVDDSGNWTASLSELTRGGHSIIAKATYGTLPVSAEWRFTVNPHQFTATITDLYTHKTFGGPGIRHAPNSTIKYDDDVRDTFLSMRFTIAGPAGAFPAVSRPYVTSYAPVGGEYLTLPIPGPGSYTVAFPRSKFIGYNNVRFAVLDVNLVIRADVGAYT